MNPLSLRDRGLDLVLGGGIHLVARVPGRSGTSILIRGPAGAGKTLVGLHIALSLAQALRGAIAYGCIELLPSELEAQVRSHRESANNLRIVHAGTENIAPVLGETLLHARLLELGADNPESLGEEIQRFWDDLTTAKVKPTVLVIDSLIDGYGLGSSASREFADAVCKLTAHLGAVLILLEECTPGAASPWVYAADTVLELATPDARGATERQLTVLKHRFGPSDAGPHRFLLDARRDDRSFPGGDRFRLFPRPSAWLEPWAGLLPSGVRSRFLRDFTLSLPFAPSPMEVRGLVVAVHGPDAQHVVGIASKIVPVPAAQFSAFVDLLVHFNLPLGPPEVGASESGRIVHQVGIAHPYLSPHRLLRILLDEIMSLEEANHEVRRVVLGDLRALRSFADPVALREALGVFCALMRRHVVAVVLYESVPSRVSYFEGGRPRREPGLDEPPSVDFADVAIEVLGDSAGWGGTPERAIVTEVRSGTITVRELS